MIKRGILQKDKKVLVINQIDAEKQKLPEYEVEIAFDNNFYLKGYAPTKPQEVKESEVKSIRDEMINSMTWHLERAKEQKELGIEPTENYQELLEYRQHLREYPNNRDDWYEHLPKTFEEWKENLNT